ncbi:MAG: type II toxin-antitoxin system VapC family toxin [Anaerolineae bacterium]
MTVLLDTHAFLWAVYAPYRLSPAMRELLSDSDNDVLVSAAVAWEIAIKYSTGKLTLAEPPSVFVPRHMVAARMSPLPITVEHALRVGALPLHHRDPFDRLLVAQSQVEGLPIVSCDPHIARYDVEVIW